MTAVLVISSTASARSTSPVTVSGWWFITSVTEAGGAAGASPSPVSMWERGSWGGRHAHQVRLADHTDDTAVGVHDGHRRDPVLVQQPQASLVWCPDGP